MRIGILGSGVVGQALTRGLARHGHDVRIGTRKDSVEDLPVGNPGEVVESADLVFLSGEYVGVVQGVSADGEPGSITFTFKVGAPE